MDNNLVTVFESRHLKKQDTELKPGYTVRVHQRIKEGEKERIQIFEGIVIAMKNAEGRSAFTVRKVSYGVGVERVFPINAPVIQKIEVINQGRVRRAKLYYLRDLSGKKARITTIEGDRAQEVATAAAADTAAVAS